VSDQLLAKPAGERSAGSGDEEVIVPRRYPVAFRRKVLQWQAFGAISVEIGSRSVLTGTRPRTDP
jgi:hypothetical protein